VLRTNKEAGGLEKQVLLKYWYLSIKLHSITSQKTTGFKLTDFILAVHSPNIGHY
jgi:hypothetical protein